MERYSLIKSCLCAQTRTHMQSEIIFRRAQTISKTRQRGKEKKKKKRSLADVSIVITVTGDASFRDGENFLERRQRRKRKYPEKGRKEPRDRSSPRSSRDSPRCKLAGGRNAILSGHVNVRSAQRSIPRRQRDVSQFPPLPRAVH